MGNLPYVSIIISNYNGINLLNECLSSLMKLSYPSFEVIVVDAGSDDGAPDFIARNFPQVTLIRDGRIGIGTAINKGIAVAKGDIIIFDYNSDETASQDWLKILVEELLIQPKRSIVGGARIIHGTNLVDDVGMKVYFFGHMTKITHGQEYISIPKETKEVDYLNMIATWKKTFEEVGSCDEVYYIYGEDPDFCLRAKKAGYKIVMVPRAVTYHRTSAIIGQQTPRQIYLDRRSHIRLILKLFPIYAIPIAMMWILLLTLLDAIVLVPPLGELVNRTKYGYWSQRNTMAHFRASLNAIGWNVKNLGSTMKVRYQKSSKAGGFDY